MASIPYPPGYYDPPEDSPCYECHQAPCIDGKVDGRDGDGRETSDECLCRCHMTKKDRWNERQTERYEQEREGA